MRVVLDVGSRAQLGALLPGSLLVLAADHERVLLQELLELRLLFRRQRHDLVIELPSMEQWRSV